LRLPIASLCLRYSVVQSVPSENSIPPRFAENLFLRHQLAIALQRAPPRFRLRGGDRALLIWMTRLWPGLINAAQVVQPEIILRWHRAGFKVFWRWKIPK
jgi:hypothetical protein